jgi:tetratricopeptide (TPR) repeat protein
VTISAGDRRAIDTAIPGGADEVILRLPLPGGNRKLVKGKSNHDLVAHVWAGLPVLVHLLATDESGQTGVSAVEPVVLPERRFSHPVAKEIYELRKRLTANDRDRRLGILKLDQIAEYPERFAGNYTVYLSLRVARERLRQDKRDAAVAEVQQMLWNTALRLEEGRTSDASRDLAAAQRALAEALDRNADIKELERLMNEVQKALQKFMSSLMRELRQRGQLPPTDPNAEVTNMQDLQRLLDRMRELMRQGSREAAKQLMAELQRMLQSLRGALARRGQQSEEARRAQQTMRELRAIIRRQQKLLDETFRSTRPGNRGRPGEERSEANTDGLDEQQAIRRELGKMMRKFGEQAGEIPKGLGDAERSMRRSERAFGQGRPGDSIDPQNQALDALRRGAQNSARALARRLGRGGIGRGRFDPRGGRFGAFTGPRLRGLRPGNRDPFGRQLEEGSSGTATGRVKIPEESEIQRARKILNELRKRLGDQWRPEVELDYIERLLKRF